MEGVTHLTDIVVNQCKVKASNALNHSSSTNGSDVCLDDVFDGCGNPFKGLETAYYQTQFVHNNLSYVVSLFD